MAFGRGPSIVKDGLVLAYDAANDRSFRGEPTVNLVPSPFNYSSYAYVSGPVITETLNENSINTNVRRYTITNSINVARAAIIPNNLQTGLHYTFSFKWKYNGTNTTEPIISIASDKPAPEAGNPSNGRSFQSTNTTNIGNGWNFTEYTVVFSSLSTGAIILTFGISTGSNSSFIGNTFDVYEAQFEQKPYATPFVLGTRGTTVATGGGLVDRSGSNNHGELVNGINFDSNNFGSLQFDGVDDFVTIPNITMGNGNLPWTISAWTKTTTTANALGQGSIISNSSGGPVYSMLGVNNGRIVYWTYQNNAWSQKLGNSIVNDGNWHNLTWVNYQNSTMDMYVDGVLDTNVANSTSGNNNPLDIVGGSWAGRYSGLISNLSIYKTKSLTPQEVQQNFNATKSRYGL
jgi:hypothetical protein